MPERPMEPERIWIHPWRHSETGEWDWSAPSLCPSTVIREVEYVRSDLAVAADPPGERERRELDYGALYDAAWRKHYPSATTPWVDECHRVALAMVVDAALRAGAAAPSPCASDEEIIVAAVIRMWEADTGIRFPGAHPPTEAGYPMLYRYARAALPEVKARELDRIIDEVEGTAAPAPGSGEASER